MEPTRIKYSQEYLKQSHKSCSHKNEIIESNLCACFYCKQIFEPKEIKEWIEGSIENEGTAICPKCGIDSVLSSKLPIFDKQFLIEMNNYWF